MRTGRLEKGEWEKLDNFIRAGIKNTLNIPEEAWNDYIYGPSKSGCAGVPDSGSDHQLIDNAFKLLTSKDPGTRELALDDLQSTVQKRLGRQADQHDLGNYLSGYNEREFRRNTNAIATIWTNGRKVSTRREVNWTFENLRLSISFDGKTLHDKQSRGVLSSLRQSIRARHMTRLCESPTTVSKYPDWGVLRGFAQSCKANVGVIALVTKSMQENDNGQISVCMTGL
jgi:hypothetical protein